MTALPIIGLPGFGILGVSGICPVMLAWGVDLERRWCLKITNGPDLCSIFSASALVQPSVDTLRVLSENQSIMRRAKTTGREPIKSQQMSQTIGAWHPPCFYMLAPIPIRLVREPAPPSPSPFPPLPPPLASIPTTDRAAASKRLDRRPAFGIVSAIGESAVGWGSRCRGRIFRALYICSTVCRC